MLIIYAHPNKDGHSGAILKEVERILGERKIEYEMMDLYTMNYDPVLYMNEHYTSGGRKVSQENKEIQKRIKREDKFIFIYPTWWNNMPAILKGFFDKVFVNGFAFKYINSIPRGLLKGKAVIFSTTGAPRLWAWLLARDRALKLITKDVLRFCGVKGKGYSIGRANKFNERQERKVKKMVNKGLKHLNVI